MEGRFPASALTQRKEPASPPASANGAAPPLTSHGAHTLQLPRLPPAKAYAATVELIECLALPPLRTLKLREAAALPGGIAAQEKVWLLRLARRAITHAEHSSSEEGDTAMVDTWEEVLWSLAGAPDEAFSAAQGPAPHGIAGREDRHVWDELARAGALLRKAYKSRHGSVGGAGGGAGAAAAGRASGTLLKRTTDGAAPLAAIPGVRAVQHVEGVAVPAAAVAQPELVAGGGEEEAVESEDLDNAGGTNTVPGAFTSDPTLPASLAAGEGAVTRNIMIAGIVWMVVMGLLLGCSRRSAGAGAGVGVGGAKGRGARHASAAPQEGSLLPTHRPMDSVAAMTLGGAAAAALLTKGSKQGGKSN